MKWGTGNKVLEVMQLMNSDIVVKGVHSTAMRKKSEFDLTGGIGMEKGFAIGKQ